MAVLVQEPVDYNPETADWQKLLYRTTLEGAGLNIIGIEKKSDGTALIIKKGSRIELNGSFYLVTEDEGIGGNLASNIYSYVYARASDGNSVYFEVDMAKPAWQPEKGGWFDGLNRRAIGLIYSTNGLDDIKWATIDRKKIPFENVPCNTSEQGTLMYEISAENEMNDTINFDPGVYVIRMAGSKGHNGNNGNNRQNWDLNHNTNGYYGGMGGNGGEGGNGGVLNFSLIVRNKTYGTLKLMSFGNSGGAGGGGGSGNGSNSVAGRPGTSGSSSGVGGTQGIGHGGNDGGAGGNSKLQKPVIFFIIEDIEYICTSGGNGGAGGGGGGFNIGVGPAYGGGGGGGGNGGGIIANPGGGGGGANYPGTSGTSVGIGGAGGSNSNYASFVSLTFTAYSYGTAGYDGSNGGPLAGSGSFMGGGNGGKGGDGGAGFNNKNSQAGGNNGPGYFRIYKLFDGINLLDIV